MREIKFRAWDAKQDQMDYPEDGYFSIGIESTGEFFGWFENDDGGYRVELMQYTGLKDKSGREIYEGDIIRHQYGYNKYTGKVFWDEENCMFKYTMKNWSDPVYYWDMREQSKMPEIIGNIYEHKDLLEKGEK